MSTGLKITVAGAGVLGLTTALALADAGAAVTVWDPAAPGDNASGVAAGMLAPVFEAVLDPTASSALDLLLAARNLWPALEARAAASIDRSGALAVGDGAWLAQVGDGMRALGVHPAELPDAAMADIAPGLSQAYAEGLLTREDWRLDAPATLAVLRRAAQAAGVVFRAECCRGLGDAERLVVATGAGADLAGLAPELARLAPIKGHILRARAAPYDGVVVRGQGIYAAPDVHGMILGATMEPGLADRVVDPGQVERLRQAGAGLFPAVAGAEFSVAAAVRAATPDGLPLVGASAAPGVFLAVGARRNGWLLAPLAAKIVTACVTGGDPGVHAARLDPRRFDAG